MNNVQIMQGLEDANKLVMTARIASQHSVVLDKLRRIATYLESQMRAILSEYAE